MDCRQNAKIWQVELAKKLKDNYGLPEEEALKKTEVWLNWLQMPSNLQLEAFPPRPSESQPSQRRR
jgi:hypothetical protein